MASRGPTKLVVHEPHDLCDPVHEHEVEEELDEGGALVLWRDERSSYLRDTTPRQSLDEAV